jgi:flagellar M-ring protein FliF
MAALLELLRRLGPARLAAMGAVALALAAFFGFVLVRATRAPLAVLYTELSPADAGAILRELEARGLRHDLSADGRSIRVPADQAARLRMDFAARNLPSAGGAGYELFDKSEPFGISRDLFSVRHLRALEGELARSIRALSRVESARVHLVVPERRLFERDREAARASIVLRTRGDLDPAQVRAVRHLVASAVQGLAPEGVSIVDEAGRLLADGAQGPVAGLDGAEDRRTRIERQLRADIEAIVASVVGRDRARVRVAAEIDLSRVQQTKESFDPEGRVLRSSQTRGETQSSSEAGRNDAASLAAELPGARAPAAAAGTRENAQKTEETANYEISRTTRTEVSEPGRIRRLSVAVLVDGLIARGPDGAPVWQPRPAEELERIATLVRGAIGFDAGRGDRVEVVNLRFAEPPAVATPPEPSLVEGLMPDRAGLMRLIELGVLALLTLLVLLVAVRPLVRRVVGPEAGSGLALPAPGASLPGLVGPGGAERPAAPGERILELVRDKPEAATLVVRDWVRSDLR